MFIWHQNSHSWLYTIVRHAGWVPTDALFAPLAGWPWPPFIHHIGSTGSHTHFPISPSPSDSCRSCKIPLKSPTSGLGPKSLPSPSPKGVDTCLSVNSTQLSCFSTMGTYTTLPFIHKWLFKYWRLALHAPPHPHQPFSGLESRSLNLASDDRLLSVFAILIILFWTCSTLHEPSVSGP